MTMPSLGAIVILWPSLGLINGLSPLQATQRDRSSMGKAIAPAPRDI
ncbi:hypothetical protein [Limnothrix redekei]|uniref:Uncharacterized protein n=1 Tax=Limnothrix redekei LRLZ20PSL1 TaxID=3112953 RepID=A0ABW7CF89_9CYAN